MTEASDSKRRKIAGFTALCLGFLMILANALDYLLDLDANLMPLMIIGLALVAVGANLTVKQ